MLPQGVRRVVPALVNDFVSMQKDVGLISILGVVDAISAANIAKAVSYNYTAFVIAGLLFILLSLPFVQLTEPPRAPRPRPRAAGQRRMTAGTDVPVLRTEGLSRRSASTSCSTGSTSRSGSTRWSP